MSLSLLPLNIKIPLTFSKGPKQVLVSKVKITIPTQVTCFFGSSRLIIQGLRGTLHCEIPSKFKLLRYTKESSQETSFFELSYFTTKDLIEFNNLVGNIYGRIIGVSCGYKRKLKIIGVGYKTYQDANFTLKFVLGYSHHLYFHLGATVLPKFGRKNNRLVLTSPSLPLVTGVTAALNSFKKPDVYKGKGVRFRGVKLRKKEGKKKK